MKKIFRILTNGYFETFTDFYRTQAVIIVLLFLAFIFSYLVGYIMGIAISILLTVGFDTFAGIGRVSPLDSRFKDKK